MQGLDPEKIYFCEELNLTASGARLMNLGLNFFAKLGGSGSAGEFWFEEVKA